MGRQARASNKHLAEALRAYMSDRNHTVTSVAKALQVDKATVSRTLRAGAFSPSLEQAVLELLEPTSKSLSAAELLQQSLRLLAASDRLRSDAERMIRQALDLARRTK